MGNYLVTREAEIHPDVDHNPIYDLPGISVSPRLDHTFELHDAKRRINLGQSKFIDIVKYDQINSLYRELKYNFIVKECGHNFLVTGKLVDNQLVPLTFEDVVIVAEIGLTPYEWSA